ncbi:MAG TPA: hypothetical protein VHL09_11165 [Dehalococcoidia bacterium]|nr:hypothetical protein [Dehalococcoidia bacterium]
MKIQVLNPEGVAKPLAAGLAPRVDRLDGKRIGFLNNTKANVDILFDRIEEILSERYRIAGVVRTRKANAAVPAPAGVIEQLVAECDVVITASGD